ncbi:MAG: putative glyoxalase superfamily protein PhnB [Gammaproteobacteria bacterium]|jgi:uncharacterized glyoxalase superfamily protein PhnB
MKSLFPDICSQHLPELKDFYTLLFDFEVIFEIDWYIQLKSPNDDNLQLAYVKHDHPSVPAPYQRKPQGVIITIESDDIAGFHQKAQQLNYPFIQPLRDEVWGQRHFMLEDPNNLLVDVVLMIEPEPEFLRANGLLD